jgi:hypothetical protein
MGNQSRRSRIPEKCLTTGGEKDKGILLGLLTVARRGLANRG